VLQPRKICGKHREMISAAPWFLALARDAGRPREAGETNGTSIDTHSHTHTHVHTPPRLSWLLESTDCRSDRAVVWGFPPFVKHQAFAWLPCLFRQSIVSFPMLIDNFRVGDQSKTNSAQTDKNGDPCGHKQAIRSIVTVTAKTVSLLTIIFIRVRPIRQSDNLGTSLTLEISQQWPPY